jgi:3D (Asp-Asp-Asp) domain-containing protein
LGWKIVLFKKWGATITICRILRSDKVFSILNKGWGIFISLLIKKENFICVLIFNILLIGYIGFANSYERVNSAQDREEIQIEWRVGLFTAYTNTADPMEGGKYAALHTPKHCVPVVKGTIAADPNIYAYGTILYVPEYGYGVVADCGSAIRGPDRFDLAFPNKSPRSLYGFWGKRNGYRYGIVYRPLDTKLAIQEIREFGVNGYLERIADMLDLDLKKTPSL